jgi:hypothetical protein
MLTVMPALLGVTAIATLLDISWLRFTPSIATPL